MSGNYTQNSMGKNGLDLTQKRFVKFAMPEFKEPLSYLVIFDFLTLCKGTIDTAL